MPAGRPLKFKTPEELQKKIDAYFAKTPLEKQMITGLAVYLKTDRATLCRYELNDDFLDVVRDAKTKIEMAYEARGLEKGGAFDIFRLKNMGWTDRQELDHSNKGEKFDAPTINFFSESGRKLAEEYENKLKDCE